MKITVIGNGGWGTALAKLLDSYGHEVTVWGPFALDIDDICAKNENVKFLPGVALPESLRWVAEPTIAMDGAEAVVMASPSRYYSDVCHRFQGLIDPETLFVSVTKGLCEKTHVGMSSLAHRILGTRRIVTLSGPSHAEEVARELPTAVVAAAKDMAVAREVQMLFTGNRFRVYTSTDPLGVELGGAVKNVIAVAVGVSDGMGFGDNTRAALITRGLAEMRRLGTALGAQPETFAGLSGVGDLIVTCCSPHSRNHAVGERLGRGEDIAEILESMQMVAEGVWNSHIIDAMACDQGVEMPISALVHQFCDKGLKPHDAVDALMGRDTKPET